MRLTKLFLLRRKLVAAVASMVGLMLLAAILWNQARVGVIIDVYKNVPVYDNGLFFFRGYGRHYSADNYYYGQKWQCVEYVKRFYKDARQHEMPDVWGHAKNYFDPDIPDGHLNPARGLIQYHNGGTMKPQVDDVLVFRDTKYGHIAIITDVTETSVEVIQQNIVFRPRQRFHLEKHNGGYVIRTPRTPAGWLRLGSISSGGT